ncbi:hypothetical protein CWATWH0402_2679 [Crocosphaera watsonii WH 0402]|uniref:Uncharacterized protein n=2 Tax=Crocosphaera watsonii TaxID=263511 RepID=T2JQ20_CROWT|nr:hypothetical protein CWATWH0005_2618 [Crocosphaera watsonii WH 0005]CCQ66657.1 hypothetical protein CWATWH0402_2679 [Crocosphaera watsonii WH 0402]
MATWGLAINKQRDPRKTVVNKTVTVRIICFSDFMFLAI